MAGDERDAADASKDEPLLLDLESIPVAALYRRGERVVAVNTAFTQLTGRRAAEIVGRDARELITEYVVADDAAVMHDARAAAEQRNVRTGELWCRVTDHAGTQRFVRVIWRPVAGGPTADREHVVFLLPADVDASERELAERLTRSAADLLRSPDEPTVLERAAEVLAAGGYTVTFLLLRADEPLLAYGPTRTPIRPDAPIGFQAVRPPREILTRINPDFHQRRAAFFQRPEELVRRTYPPEIAARANAVVTGRRTVQVPLFVADEPYGAMVVTDDRLTHVSVGTLEMYGQLVCAAVENVRLHERARARLDELQRLQSALVQRERLAALGEAAAIMAHEVRNPIGAILNAVVLLGRGAAATGTPDAELHRMIAEEASRLGRLVNDLLTLGRPLAPRVRPTLLAEAVTRAVEVLGERGELLDCAVDLVASDVAVAAADPELAELALINVLRNAAQASPRGGRVRVRVHAEGGERVAVEVEDDGPGFSDEVTRRLCEPFFTTRATGTGIGLAVVRRVLDAHGGSLAVGRTAAGGARVSLQFPAWRG